MSTRPRWRDAALLAAVVISVATVVSGCGGDSAPPSADPPQAASIRDHPLPRVVFGPWYGSGCPANGRCGCGNARTLAEEFTCQMDMLKEHDLPITTYLFDGNAWSRGDSSATSQCSGPECCDWALGDQVIARLRSTDTRALLHFWGGCHDDVQYQRAYDRLGQTLLGFYLDDGSSDAEARQVSSYLKTVLPGDSEVVFKVNQMREPSTTDEALRTLANVCFVGDLSTDFAGLREGVSRVLSKAPLLPAPFNEFTGYDDRGATRPTDDVYVRRLHFGCFQPVMAHTPWSNLDPWAARYAPKVLESYHYYAWLHKELVPYFYSHAYAMHEDPSLPVLRAGTRASSFRVGDELFAAIVTSAAQTLTVELPDGQWLNYWDESQVLSGRVTNHPAPVGNEPTFIRLGALIPMDVTGSQTGHGTAESAGALTVLVYPAGASSFRYRDEGSNAWCTLHSELTGDHLTLSVLPSAPGTPILYRIGRWGRRPASLSVAGGVVKVNQGGGAPEVASEGEVNGSQRNAWYYDEAAQRLIVKAFRN